MNMTNFEIAQSLKKMHRVQLKQISDMMGIDFDRQPNAVKELRPLTEKLAIAAPDEYTRLYTILVKHETPTVGAQPGANLSDAERAKMARMLSEHVTMLEENYSNTIKARLDDYAKRKTQSFTEKAEGIIERAKKQFITHQVKIGSKKVRKVKGTPPKQFKKLLELAQSRKNILMVGPSGCGKTHVAGMLADAMGLDYSAQSCSVGVSESSFTGWLLPTGDNGRFNHVVSEFLRIYENGGVFLFDELDNADPNVLVFMNMALAQDHFYLPQRFKKPRVERHPDFVAIAAANTYGGGADVLYTSRNALDEATLDRFRMGTIAMDYDETVEESLIDKKVEVLHWGRAVRQSIKKNNLAKLMSTRAMIDAQDMMVDHDWTLEDCEQTYFANWTREEMKMIESDMREWRNAA